MHELTLLYGVVDKVGKVVEENGLDHVDAIVVEVGEATSVIPEFLQDGYEVISGPRTTGDGYYESCIIGIEGNQIELTISESGI